MSNQVNSAVAAMSRGLLDGGANVAYNFPGFFSHDIFRELGGTRISLNERVAYAEAFGASLGGLRSVVTFKNVGMNVASDAYLHSIIAGVRAGMAVVVTDDISVWGSQESQDSRSYMEFFGGVWLEPATIQDAYDFGRESFLLSETLDMPIVIRLTNPLFQLKQEFISAGLRRDVVDYEPARAEKFVVHPVYFEKQLDSLREKNEVALRCSESRVASLADARQQKGVVVVGAAKLTDKASSGADVLMLNTYPLPADTLRKFAATHSELDVIEHGSPYVARKLRELTSEVKLTSMTPTELGKGGNFMKWTRYSRFFAGLASIAPDMVVGDIAQFTVEKTDSVRVALSLGTAVSTAIGYAEARPGEYTFCLSGDCSFLHEGIGIIDEALTRGINLGIVIIDNGGSWCTGGQEPAGFPGRIVEHEKLQNIELSYDDCSEADIIVSLNRMREFKGVSVMHLKVPMGSFSREGDNE